MNDLELLKLFTETRGQATRIVLRLGARTAVAGGACAQTPSKRLVHALKHLRRSALAELSDLRDPSEQLQRHRYLH